MKLNSAPCIEARVELRKLDWKGREPLTPSGIDAMNGFESLSVSTEPSTKWVDAKKGFEPMSWGRVVGDR